MREGLNTLTLDAQEEPKQKKDQPPTATEVLQGLIDQRYRELQGWMDEADKASEALKEAKEMIEFCEGEMKSFRLAIESVEYVEAGFKSA